MNLKCKINGKEYELLVQGNTFSDEYNETLDSGNIILAHVNKIKKLKPFDDVFIYDNEFNGYDFDGVVQGKNNFFRHLIIDSYTEEFVNIKDKVYKYKIALMSEIKALEKIQCPNISITQPLKSSKKISVYQYLDRFTKIYSPKYKKVHDKNLKQWKYVQKYTVDPNLEKIFGNVYAPDFSLNAPSLRDILSKLMIVKDMIPYVENGVIKALDITQRKNKINLEDLPCTNIVGSMRSNEYCDGLRRNYSEALSQDSTCSCVEYLGFRNSDNALMTLDNMRLETRFPIYKINKMYMCYYKKSNIVAKDSKGNVLEEYFHLCKQDITPLIKLNTERNALSKDWDDFSNNQPTSMEKLAQYKLATLGYDIGSNKIIGFGESYEYPRGWWQRDKKTYIENILRVIDNFDNTGIRGYDYLIQNTNYKSSLKIEKKLDIFDTIMTPFAMNIEKLLNIDSALDMKGLFFLIEYQGFYNGSVIHSKDFGEDNIISNDNSSSSLALLELDGLSQKEKVNRLGNKTYQFTIRYDDYNDLSNLLNLGDYFSHDEEDDIIIYHREIAIYDNYVLATYFAAKDYVLKNYYTSVYARHRTWNLIPYGESVTRSENKKTYMILSKENLFYERENELSFSDTFNNENLFSCFISSVFNQETNSFDISNKINSGYISCYSKDYDEEGNYLNTSSTKFYLSDINAFSAGTSLCFNIRTLDNISVGSYISKPSPFEKDRLLQEVVDRLGLDTKKDYTGSKISLHKIIDDDETGHIEKLGVSFFHYDTNELYKDYFMKYDKDNSASYVDNLYNSLLILPKVEKENLINNISQKINICDKDAYSTDGEEMFYIYKDNKEMLDITLQIEPITTDKNIVFSSWFMKLNDMLSNYYKTEDTFLWSTNLGSDLALIKKQIGIYKTAWTYDNSPMIVLYLSDEDENYLRDFCNLFPNSEMEIKNFEEVVYEKEKGKLPTLGGQRIHISYLKVKFLKPISIIDVEEKGEIHSVFTYEVEQTVGAVFDEKEGMKYYKTIEHYEFVSNAVYFVRLKEYFKMDSFPEEKRFLEDKRWFGIMMTSFKTTINGVETTIKDGDDGFYFAFENGSSKELFDSVDSLNGILSWNLTKEKTYYKNMYLVLSTENLKNTLVYDSYKLNEFPSNYIVLSSEKVNDYFTPSIIGETRLFNEIINFNLIDFSQLPTKKDENGDDCQEYEIFKNFSINNKEKYTSIIVKHTNEFDVYSLIYNNNGKKSNAYASRIDSLGQVKTKWMNEKYRTIIGEDFLDNDFFIYQNSEFVGTNQKNYISINNKKIKELYSKIVVIKSDFDRNWFKNHINFGNANTENSIGIGFQFSFKCVGNGREYSSIVFSKMNNGVETLAYGYIDENGEQQFDTVYAYVGNKGWIKPEIYKKIILLQTTGSQILDWLNNNSENTNKEIESIQYWFMDTTQENQEDNLLNFVFGVNLTEEDKQKDEIRIYASLVSNRDPRVYDEYHNVIGKVHNYLDDNNKNYGEAQYYDEEDI